MRPSDLAKPHMVFTSQDLVRYNRDFVYFTEANEVKIVPGRLTEGILGSLRQSIRDDPEETIEGLFWLKAFGVWGADGPKSFYPTNDQCDALEHVSMNLSVADYRQPYPAIAVVFPRGRYEYRVVIVYHEVGNEFILSSYFDDYKYASWCISRHYPDKILETQFDTDEKFKIGYRVAVNSCLALAHFGSSATPMYPHDAERDRELSKEATERGRRARDRISTMPLRISFSQEVVLVDPQDKKRDGQPTGREVTCHWRRGHWAVQPYGPGRSLRKTIFRKPVLVRADLFIGDTSDTSVSYRTSPEGSKCGQE